MEAAIYVHYKCDCLDLSKPCSFVTDNDEDMDKTQPMSVESLNGEEDLFYFALYEGLRCADLVTIEIDDMDKTQPMTVESLNGEEDLEKTYEDLEKTQPMIMAKPVKRKAADIFAETLSKRKTQSLYDLEWARFLDYSGLTGTTQPNEITEEHFAQYLDMLHSQLQHAPTTLWSSFSKLNTKIKDLGGAKLQDKYPRLMTLLKQYQSGYVPKRADVFSLDQIKEFLENSPNEGKNLLNKAVVCFALNGVCVVPIWSPLKTMTLR